MIIPDHKRITTVILSRLKNNKTESMAVKPEKSVEGVDELEIAAQDLLQAINDKSVLGVKAALKSFMDLIQEDDAEEDSKDELAEDK